MVKKLIYIFLGIGLFFGIFLLLSQPPKAQTINTSATPSTEASEKDLYKDSPVYDNPDLVFYWGNGCPHCENVEKWLNENNKDKKIKVNYKEVYYNKDNQTTLYNTAKQYCPEIIENGGIGVPTSFDPSTKKCLQGDNPIIEFLTSKLAK